MLPPPSSSRPTDSESNNKVETFVRRGTVRVVEEDHQQFQVLCGTSLDIKRVAMALKIEKFVSRGKGNGLRATASISPGELVYVAKPFVYAVVQSSWGKVCELCLCESPLLLQCSQCKFAKYCSKSCQREAWPDHKLECKCLRGLESDEVSHTVRLVVKIILKQRQKKRCPSEELYSMSEIVSNYCNKENVEMRIIAECYAVKLKMYLKRVIPDPSKLPADRNFAETFCSALVNRLSITNGMQEHIADGLYPAISLLNHSCIPNCFSVYKGSVNYLCAIKAIQPGEELTTAYVETLMPVEVRQRELMHNFCFQCSCYRCRTHDDDYTMLVGDREASEETKSLVFRVLQLEQEGKWAEIVALCRHQLMNNSSRLPDENMYQLLILDFAMAACLALNMWAEALEYGLRTLAPYRIYHAGENPKRALRMCAVGKLQVRLAKREEGLKNLREALDFLKNYFAQGDKMIQEIIQIVAHDDRGR